MSSTRDRLNSIIDQHMKSVPPGALLSISELSSKAKLSRTTIYRHYPDIVERLHLLREPGVKLRKENDALKHQILRERILAQKILIQQLSKSCVELLAELHDAREDQRTEREAFQLRIATLEKKLGVATKVTSLPRRT